MENKSYIRMMDEWFVENDFVFKKVSKSEEEVVFLIYEDAIHQNVLLLELTIAENGKAKLLSVVAPYFPQRNIAGIEEELKKLSFIHAGIAEFYVADNSVVAAEEFEIPNAEDCIFTVCFKLDMFKGVIDDSIPGINYAIWRGNSKE